jgi:hypothetical protein
LVRDGQAMPERGDGWKLWSVPGLFEILEIDLAEQRRLAAAGGSDKLYLSAEFDPNDGRPVRYRNIRVGGERREYEWHIEPFSPR